MTELATLPETDRRSLRPETAVETLRRRANEEAWRPILEPSVTADACALRRPSGRPKERVNADEQRSNK